MPEMVQSYYDAVGLLAICDAIETVEGIQFKPSAGPRTTPASMSHSKINVTLPAPYPPVLATPAQTAQHPYLSHIPPHSTVNLNGAVNYSQSQSTAYQQFKTMTGGNVPFQKTVTPAPTPGQVTTPSHAPPPPVQNSYNYPIQPAQSSSSPVLMRRQTPLRNPSPPTSIQQQGTHSTSQVNGNKIEECHVCRRIFKGPKASTHKQQHIRRLHPNEYTPKRGGKRRVP